jgi:hypothetical protein
MSLQSKQRLFTVDEANELVPVLSRLIERVQRQYRSLLAELSERGMSPDDLEGSLVTPEHQALQACLDEITEAIAEIESHGCQFKGLDLGLVDFPALINNEIAYLCWQYGEDKVSFWHSLDEGFRGRNPITPERPGPRTVN